MNMKKKKQVKMLIIPILLLLVTLFSLLAAKKRSSSSSKAPPGPWKLPIIGTLHHLLIGNLPPHQRLRQLSQKHGPVMQLQLGEVTTVIISTPDAAKQVMKTHDLAFASRPAPGQLLAPTTILYGCNDVAFAPYGEHWRQMRKLCIVELLSAKRVASFRGIRLEEVASLVAAVGEWRGRCGELRRPLIAMASRVTSRSAFGELAGEIGEGFLAVVGEIVKAHDGFGLSDLFPSLKFVPVVTGFLRKLKSLRGEADSLLEGILDQHRGRRRGEGDEGKRRRGSDEAEDIVDILLNLQETGDLPLPLTTDAIKGVVLDMFLGGVETSASTIEWTMSEMVKNPRVLQLAREEVRRVFRNEGNVHEDKLHELTYLHAVVKETLRLHPAGPLVLPRETRETVQIYGFEIPAKTRVLVNVWAIGRDPSYWINAEEFCPERFMDSSIDYKGTHFEYIPFGAGRRICPGMLFGMTIVQLTLANLLFHFDWIAPGGVESLDMTERFGISLTRKQALQLIPITPLDATHV